MSDISFQFDRSYVGGKSAGKGIKSMKSVAIKTATKKTLQQPQFGNKFPAKTSYPAKTTAIVKGFLPAGKSIKKTTSAISQQKSKAIKEYYKKRKSGSQKSGLIFPVGRIISKMKKTKIADRVSKIAGVYLTAVMEYMVSEIVENAGNIVREQKKRYVFPRHVYLAVEEDHEMKKYLGNDVILPTVGRKIYTHPFLKQKANERVSQKNFQVVDDNLKDIKEYPTASKAEKRPRKGSDSDDG